MRRIVGEREMTSENKIIFSIFVSVLIDLLGFTVILPLFPSLLEFYDKNEKNDGLYSSILSGVEGFRTWLSIPQDEPVTSVLFGGFIGSIFSLLQFLNAPLFGALSDRFGRRIVIMASLFGSAIACQIWACADTFVVFLVARTVAGLAEGNISICLASLADLNDQKAKSKGMAMIGVAYSIGFTIGPMIGAAMSSYIKSDMNFFYVPAYFAFIVCLLDIIFVYFFLPETLPPEKRANSFVSSFKDGIELITPTKIFSFRSVNLTPHERCGASITGLAYFLYLFFFSGLEFTLTFLTHNRYAFSRMDQGKMFAVLGVIMSLIQGGYIRKAMVGQEIKIAKRSIKILIVGFLIVAFSTSSTTLYIGLMPFAFAAASVVPCLSVATSNYGGPSQKGRMMGSLRSLGALARATGPCVCGISYWLIGSRLTYIIGGLALLVPIKVLNLLEKIEAKHLESQKSK